MNILRSRLFFWITVTSSCVVGFGFVFPELVDILWRPFAFVRWNVLTPKSWPVCDGRDISKCTMFSSPRRSSQKVRVFDIFTYNCEEYLLEVRAKTLEDVVDVFVVVEGQVTFQGQPKDRCFLKLLDKWPWSESLRKKFFYVSIPPWPGYLFRTWQREFFTRNHILDALPRLNVSKNDVILLGDADEIPRPDVIEWIRSRELPQRYSIRIELMLFYYQFCFLQRERWKKFRICSAEEMKKSKVTREVQGNYENTILEITDGGWHCSFCMTAMEIQRKFKSNSHTEYAKPPFTDLDFIKGKMEKGENLFSNEKIDLVCPNDRPRFVHPYMIGSLEKCRNK